MNNFECLRHIEPIVELPVDHQRRRLKILRLLVPKTMKTLKTYFLALGGTMPFNRRYIAAWA